MPAIDIQGLEKSYKTGFFGHQRKVGLRPLTLTVEEGEVFGYLGPNGAGKTTTLKLLLGLAFPSGGTARILGRPGHIRRNGFSTDDQLCPHPGRKVLPQVGARRHDRRALRSARGRNKPA